MYSGKLMSRSMEARSRTLARQINMRVGALAAITFTGMVVIVIGTIWIFLLGSHRSIQDESNKIAKDLDLSLDGLQTDLRSVGYTLHQSENIDVVLRDYLNRNPNVFYIILLDSAGQPKAQSQRIGRSAFPPFEEQPWVGSSSPYWGNLKTTEDGFPSIQLAIPYYENSDFYQERVGTPLVEIDLTTFWDQVRSVEIGRGGYAYLVDEGGTLLAHPDMMLVQQGITTEAQFGRTTDDLLTGSSNLRPDVRRGISNSGQRVVASAAGLATTPWVIIAEQPVLDVARGIVLPAGIVFILAVVVGMLITSVTTFVQQRIINPLGILRAEVDSFRNGDMTRRIHLSDQLGDEIDVLAGTFNEMANNIEERTRALIIANSRAEESNRLKTEFLSMISHELRTPLNAIMGYCGILLEGLNGEMDEDATRMVSRIDLSSHRLLNLINELLDLNRIESGDLAIKIVAFDPHALAAHWDDAHRILAEQKDLGFVVTVDPTLPHRLYGDPDRITQVVSNLLSNAFKFTETGSVELALDYNTTHWIISVADTGVGIAPEAREYIFERFRQADGSATRTYGGTGLGLTIVEQLTTMMGGDISVESEPDVGSTFTIRLPVATEKTTALAATRTISPTG